MQLFKFGPHKITSNEIFFCSKHSFGLVNLKPIVPGHVLVISRAVRPRFLDLTKEESADLMASAHSIASKLQDIHKAESFTFTIQDGMQAGQSVPHTHLHIIPRFLGDWMNNDDIYPALQAKEKEMADAIRTRGPDSDRLPRAATEMQKEASELRTLFDHYEDIWS